MAEINGSEDKTPKEFSSFDARLDKLRKEHGPDKDIEDEAHAQARGKFGPGVQVGIELLAGVAGGALMGWGLDSWLNTSPLFLILLFFLGAAAGVLNAWRYLRRFATPGETGSNGTN